MMIAISWRSLQTRGAYRFHARMLAAIRERDGAKAKAALAEDINGAAAFIPERGGLADG